MSWEDKIKQAAAAAAKEACAQERGRCMACIHELVNSMEEKASKAILITEKDEHIMNTKIRIMKGLAAQLGAMILNGVTPTGRG